MRALTGISDYALVPLVVAMACSDQIVIAFHQPTLRMHPGSRHPHAMVFHVHSESRKHAFWRGTDGNRLRYLARRLGLRVCVLFNSDMGIRRILALAGIAVTELPGEYAQPGRVRRIGYVEDHQAIAVGLAAVLSEQPDLSVVAMAPTVGELLAQSTDLDLAILDLRWAARARGVKGALDDSGGLERADETVRQSVRTVVGDALDYAEAGAVTVRTLPPRRSNLVAILAGSATAWTGDGGGADRARGEHAVGDYVR